MTTAQFRRLALRLPAAVASAHMGHPDFRVQGKVFATLFTRDDEDLGMVKLTLEQQRAFVRLNPETFAPIPGGWGRRGGTEIRLHGADAADVGDALQAAWRNTAPKRLIQETDADSDLGA